MANLLWGNVYFGDIYAGLLKQEPGGRSSFCYDSSYLSSQYPPIAHNLPLKNSPFVYEVELPPFFDNLVAEGWLEHAQTKLLGKRQASRFELLLAFGADCAGAVSVRDPSPHKITQQLLSMEDPREYALLTSRASLSGIQPKLAVSLRDGMFYPTSAGEISTHIAKFYSKDHADIIFNEYLTTLAFKTLLPDQSVVKMHLGEVVGGDENALIIERFDRSHGKRIHFEEFTQLLDYLSKDKYDGAYKDMANFIKNVPGCLPVEMYNLYQRVIAGFLLGNTDMHLKNFAMFHTDSGFRLTPNYDQVAAAIYQYRNIALSVCGISNLVLNKLKPKHIIGLGEEFGLNEHNLKFTVEKLEKNFSTAREVILNSKVGSDGLKSKILDVMDKRWNETFALIGSK